MQLIVQLPTPAFLPLDGIPKYPMNRRVDGPHSWFGCFEDEKSLFPLPVFELRSMQPVP
jgi:hypothetical protein